MAARHGGTYYLTYHRYADRKQQLTAPAAESLVPKTWQDRVVDSTGIVGQVLGEIENCYPHQFAEFLRLKKKYDPEERFQSDWYRYCKTMFADSIKPFPIDPRLPLESGQKNRNGC
jgi:hypothetical protein